MLLEPEEKVLVVHRRLFERDHQRFFVGIVEDYEAGIAKVSGYSFVRDEVFGKTFSKRESRTKLISLSSGTLILYQLPNDTDVASVQFTGDDGALIMTDGGSLRMDLTENLRGENL